MLEITILGCGASLGVPVLSCKCTICKSNEPLNKRSRPSILITQDDTNILVDFGLDIRMQLMRENIHKLDAAILTHDHADHVGGIDDLRVFGYDTDTALSIYSDPSTIDIISNRYQYMIKEKRIKMHKLPDFEVMCNIAGVDIQFFEQDHYSMNSLGIRIKDFVYSNDVIKYPEKSEKFMSNAKTWVIDCMDYTSTLAHSGLDQVLLWNEKYRPEFVWLTNMSHTIDYFEIQKQLPDNIKPLYDGQKIRVN
jgi:phosphoribosyl 1,2-cyclic phosphate phosphodiesterase